MTTVGRSTPTARVLAELKTDAEAEAFVATADLTEYDLSGMVPVRFELKHVDNAHGGNRDAAAVQTSVKTTR